MKKLKFVVAVAGILTTSFVIGQNSNSQKWSVGLNYGIIGSMNTVNKIEPIKSNAIRLNGTYMVKPNFGVMLLGGLNSFTTQDGGATKTNYVNASLEAVYVLSSLLNMEKSDFRLLVHAGPGVATMWNKDYQDVNATDPYFKDQDDILNLTVGFTPQYTLGKNFDVNLDFSYAFNMMQNRGFDFTGSDKKTGMVYNLSLGVVYKFNSKTNRSRNSFLRKG